MGSLVTTPSWDVLLTVTTSMDFLMGTTRTCLSSLSTIMRHTSSRVWALYLLGVPKQAPMVYYKGRGNFEWFDVCFLNIKIMYVYGI